MVVKLERTSDIFIETKAQAARDKEVEEPNQERIERLICEIEAAPTLLERLPQANRECVLSRLRAVQSIPASFASQERFACETFFFPGQVGVARDHKSTV